MHTSLHTSHMFHQAGDYLSFLSKKRPGVVQLPLDGILFPSQGYAEFKLLVPIYTPGWSEAL